MKLSTLVDCEDQIIERILYYTDWEGCSKAPHIVNIRDKHEGDPIHWVLDETGIKYPAVLAEHMSTISSGKLGHQRPIRIVVRLYYIIRFAEYSYPHTEVRQQLGRIIENIEASNRLGLSWVSDLNWGDKTTDNELSNYMRKMGEDYLSSSVPFTAELYYV